MGQSKPKRVFHILDIHLQQIVDGNYQYVRMCLELEGSTPKLNGPHFKAVDFESYEQLQKENETLKSNNKELADQRFDLMDRMSKIKDSENSIQDLTRKLKHLKDLLNSAAGYIEDPPALYSESEIMLKQIDRALKEIGE